MKATFIPSRFFPRCRPRASARCWPCCFIKSDLSVIALIGIILLIGIVKKNAILMIDFAVQAEREGRQVPSRRHLRSLPAALPPDHDDHHGRAARRAAAGARNGVGSELRRPLGITIVGGLIVSQMLTLFTTPVVYLYMDRLQTWIHEMRTHGTRVPTPAPAQSD